MSPDRATFIDSLAADLSPIRGPGRTAHLLLWWLLGSWLFVTSLTLATGPFRPGVAEQLLESPRFLLESVGGLAAGVLTIATAIRLGIPATSTVLLRIAPALLMLLGWVLAYVYGLVSPALEPSMLGKREECYVQVLLYGGPPLALGLFFLRRLAPFARASTGMMLGAAGLVVTTRLLRGLLFEVEPLAVVPLLTAGLALGALALAATAVPARRAATVNPAAVLRDD